MERGGRENEAIVTGDSETKSTDEPLMVRAPDGDGSKTDWNWGHEKRGRWKQESRNERPEASWDTREGRRIYTGPKIINSTLNGRFCGLGQHQ